MKSMDQASHIESLFIPKTASNQKAINFGERLKNVISKASKSLEIVKRKGFIKSLLGIAYFVVLLYSLFVLLT